MNPWMTLLVAVVSSGVLTTALNAIFNRRNLGATTERTEAERGRTDAETDEIIARTSRGLVADVEARNSELRTEIRALKDEIRGLREDAEEQRRVLILHSAWDLMAVAKVRECKPPLDLPHPPPLTPPIRRSAPTDDTP